MNRKLASYLPVLALVVVATGCPRNEYLVELTPRGSVIERKLVFYRADGVNSNGVPGYQVFPRDEVALIERLYPAGATKREGERRTATGQFSAVLPADVGEAGSYASLSNSLGTGSFYMERFRGGDDLAGRTEARAARMNQLVDLVIGWSRSELGGEAHYEDLRKFLDKDFRRDMKNMSFYLWMVQVSMAGRSERPEEFAARFGQYLVERGYFRLEDLPGLNAAFSTSDQRALGGLVQRFIASKLRIPRQMIEAGLEAAPKSATRD